MNTAPLKFVLATVVLVRSNGAAVVPENEALAASIPVRSTSEKVLVRELGAFDICPGLRRVLARNNEDRQAADGGDLCRVCRQAGGCPMGSPRRHPRRWPPTGWCSARCRCPCRRR